MSDVLRCGDRLLSLERVAVMGVLNVTPDSFSDGGLWFDEDRAVQHALQMVEEGAAIIDVGGESTRPGAASVTEEEEARRVLPVIETLARRIDVPISIDTRKVAIAERALAAGASIINDTLGEASDRAMDELAARARCAIVVMHSRGTPATMRQLTDYEDVVRDVEAFLRSRVNELSEAGVPDDAVVIDPGFGFAKSPEQNLDMLNRLEEFSSLDRPLLVGTSRKSFIGAVLDLPEDQRLEGTAATVAVAVYKGVRIVRVHDVAPIARAVRMTEAIAKGRA